MSPRGGYVMVLSPGHPRADQDGYVFEHILVVEGGLGRFLVYPEVVHHINGIKTDNLPSNLLLCANNAEHHRVHVEAKALLECGHSHWRKCHICKKYDDPAKLQFHGTTIRHRDCRKRLDQERNRKFNQGGIAA